eukprot:TRINITY_DN77311_c0_g1_i1.p1 TRINITY_DN77311_c0_g1~~TRINITY_DN77311_c0_g1_i1.p1  ORF type:complete len:355 (+),score=56.93 TRINITY_DN77311_c0_g1_i1:73-1137(+)
MKTATIQILVVLSAAALALGSVDAEVAVLAADDACIADEDSALSLRQLRGIKEQLEQQQDLALSGADQGACASWCSLQPSTAWASQTACCGCGGGSCSCRCDAWCQFQPATVWYTQTSCCSCTEAVPPPAPIASAPAVPVSSGEAAVDFCRYPDDSNCNTCCSTSSSYCVQQQCWMCQTDRTSPRCANCYEKSCMPQCQECYKSVVPAATVTPAPAVEYEPKPGAKVKGRCEAYCQWQPSAVWATQTGCCACEGGSCDCQCASWCQWQPSYAWSTQVDCCACGVGGAPVPPATTVSPPATTVVADAAVDPVADTNASLSNFATAACANHPNCAKQSLTGMCCPSVSGAILSCCS